MNIDELLEPGALFESALVRTWLLACADAFAPGPDRRSNRQRLLALLLKKRMQRLQRITPAKIR